MNDRKKFIYITVAFLLAYFLPLENMRVKSGIREALFMLQEYAREHVLLCLVPAFFIAGGIAVFINQTAIIRYFGANAKKILAYGVASVSGTILAVCSCTVLPLFASIYERGAGIGPAVAFLYSGPAINVLAIILTGKVLGLEMGIARAVGAITFAIVIGLFMELLFRKSEKERLRSETLQMIDIPKGRKLWQDGTFLGLMVAFLVFANWGKPLNPYGIWAFIYRIKWYIAVLSLIGLITLMPLWFEKDEIKMWVGETYHYAIMILPLLFGGVLVAGFFLGRPGHEAVIPSRYIESLVGNDPSRFFSLFGIENNAIQNIIKSVWRLWTCFLSSVVGALMYFATLTEVPILQGLMGAGMGKGPALSLLLAGPAVSLPNMLVINSVLGFKRTFAYISLVIVMATIAGYIYGML